MLFIRNWWILILRGLSSVVFGVYFFFYPELTLFLLARGFLFYSLIDGILCLLAAFLTHQSKLWRNIFLSLGLLGIAAAAFTLYLPLVAAVLLFATIAPWVFITGILEIVAGRYFKNDLTGTGWLTAGGIISLVIGALLIIQPFVGFSTLENLIGVFQIVRGVFNVVLAFGLKRNRAKLETILNSEIV